MKTESAEVNSSGRAAVASLRQRTLTATLWSGASHSFMLALRFGSHFVLARLLAPEAFGVFAVIWATIVAVNLFSDFGFSSNIVQSKRGNDPTYVNTIWTLQIIKGAFACFVLIIVGFFIFGVQKLGLSRPDSVYAHEQLPALFWALSLMPLTIGFESTSLAQALRDLKQKELFRFEVFIQVVSALTTIAVAATTRSIWAIVAGVLVSTSLRAALSHIIFGEQKNRFCFDRESVREALRFGGWIFLGSIFGFVSASGDRMLFGALTDSATLGCYSVALVLVTAGREVLIKWFGSAVFPAISEVWKERPQDLVRNYYRFRLITDLLVALGFGFFFFFGELLITTLYDKRYWVAGTYIQVIGLMFFELRIALLNQVWLARGETKLVSQQIALNAFVVLAAIPIGFWFNGFLGALWAVCLAWMPSLFLAYYFKKQRKLLSTRGEWIGIGLTVAAVAAMYLLRQFVGLIYG